MRVPSAACAAANSSPAVLNPAAFLHHSRRAPLHPAPPRPAPRRRASAMTPSHALADDAAAATSTLLNPGAPLLLPALGGAALVAGAAFTTLAATSARVDYATTARLEAVTPPGKDSNGKRRALLLTQPDNSSSRALFLLPDRVTHATVVAPGLDAAWWAKAGAQAGVSVNTVDSLQGLASLPPSSFDVALVRGGVLGALSTADPTGRARTAALASIARALSPGCAAVLVERLAGQGGPVAGAVRAFSRGPGSGLVEADLEILLDGVTAPPPVPGAKVKANAAPAFARVAVDTVASGADPHALVVAAVAAGGVREGEGKGGGASFSSSLDDSAVEARIGRRGKSAAGGGDKKKKGFSGS